MSSSAPYASPSSLPPPPAPSAQSPTPHPLSRPPRGPPPIPPAVLEAVADILHLSASACVQSGSLPPTAFPASSPFTVREHRHPGKRRQFSHFSPSCITAAHSHLHPPSSPTPPSPPSPPSPSSPLSSPPTPKVTDTTEPSSHALAASWAALLAEAATAHLRAHPHPQLLPYSVTFHTPPLTSPPLPDVGYIDISITPLPPSPASPSPPTLSPSTGPAPANPWSAPATFHPIGYVSSCFKLKFATPRQPHLTPSSRATLHLSPHLSPSTLHGLAGYSHVWLLFLFHLNHNPHPPPVVHPPRLGGEGVGVLATRSPHRPNPIGLSLVRVRGVDVEGRRVYLGGVDVVEGTPVLDIKPYHPSDAPQGEVEVPAWVTGEAESRGEGGKEWKGLTVGMEEGVGEEIGGMVERMEGWEGGREAMQQLIVEMIAGDPRPGYLREKREGRQAVYGMRVDALNVLYWVDDDRQHATVCGVEWVGNACEGEEDEEARTKRWLAERGRSNRFSYHALQPPPPHDTDER